MQVFWANNASMAASDSWFEAIVPERPTLLLMDEPDSPELLKRLQEQLSARAQGWKVLVAARSTHDLAIKPLVDPKFGRQVQRLELSALSKEEAEEMCATLLKVTYNMSEAGARELAEKVVKHVGCFPIWITLSVWLLQRDGGLNKLPTEFEETADRYLEKVLPNHEDATILLRQWVALLGHLNWQDDAMVAWLATQTGHTSPTKVRDCLNRLVQSGSLIAMGSQ
ncbi:MAG TPA: hypothetical protein PKY30_26420, partial [Myxococcota bacterium]|nr:hypothetical protein [Myxococcota bacterium]